ncbi:MAG: hypothetical protein ACRDVG_10290, partial [Jatrophihabitantaceae bacterium]
MTHSHLSEHELTRLYARLGYDLADAATHELITRGLPPIAGADLATDIDASPALRAARDRHNQLLEAQERAAAAFADLDEDATDEERDAADQAYETAKKAQQRALATVERLTETAASRAANPAPYPGTGKPEDRSGAGGRGDLK